MKLYIGNLSFNTTEQKLRELFEPFGVASASIVTDRETGRPRGFGFVEVHDSDQGAAAIAAMHGKSIDGRELTVNEARAKESRSGGYNSRPKSDRY